MTVDHPIPKDLREQLQSRIASMPEADLAQLYELWLLTEKLRVRRQISEQAEGEHAAGQWENLPDLIRAYRSRKKVA